MLTWSCGLLPPKTLDDVIEDLREFEGARPYMYLDTVSTVTVGMGSAIFSIDDVVSVNFVHSANRQPVSVADKKTAWQVVQNVSKPRGTPCDYSPDHFRNITSIIIDVTEIIRLVRIKLEEFYKDLVKIYPGFDSMPANAKIALFDMIYNLGPYHIEYIFVLFTKAIRSRQWERAALQSFRPQVNMARNARTKWYFESCIPKPVLDAGRRPEERHAMPPKTAALTPLPKPPQPFPRIPYHEPIPATLCIVKTPIIRQGDHGVDVRVVQNALNRVLVARRPPLTLDGRFGLMTTSAVRAVQALGGLVPDGIVGAQTRTALALVLV